MNENRKMSKKEQTDYIVQLVKSDVKYHMKKDDLRKTLKDIFDIELKKTATNEELAKAIIDNCKNRKTYYLKIYEMWKYDYFGISLSQVGELFNINRYKRKELEKYNLLITAYEYEVRAYGNYLYVPVYNVKSVFKLLGEDLDALLKEERRLERARKNSLEKSEN